MDFRVELVRRRERRALVLMVAAVVTVVAASVAYLHPPAPAGASSPPIVIAAAPPAHTSFRPVAYDILPGTGRPTGGYFVWNVAVRAGSGGHRAG